MAPQNLKIINSSNRDLVLNWQQPAVTSGLLGYIVYRSYNDEQLFERINTISDTQNNRYIDSGLDNSKNYYYRVSCIYDNVFNEDTNYQPKTLNCYTDYINKTNKLEWKQPNNTVLNYDIYRSESYNGTMNKIGSTVDLQYFDSGLNEKIMYYYKIKSNY
jgi:fibronectin type 3 domain-containing protein